jgi:hypothetical protein
MQLLPRRKKFSNAIPVELQAYYAVRPVLSRTKRWLSLLLLLAILVAAVVAGRFAFHRYQTHTSHATPSTQSEVNQTPTVNNTQQTTGTPAQTPASSTTNR